MASAAFERFRFSFFEDTNSARDGLDTVALAQIEGEEGARAPGTPRRAGRTERMGGLLRRRAPRETIAPSDARRTFALEEMSPFPL
jgi:hypothetical protein